MLIDYGCSLSTLGANGHCGEGAASAQLRALIGDQERAL
jgi:hypothetical protein